VVATLERACTCDNISSALKQANLVPLKNNAQHIGKSGKREQKVIREAQRQWMGIVLPKRNRKKEGAYNKQ